MAHQSVQNEVPARAHGMRALKATGNKSTSKQVPFKLERFPACAYDCQSSTTARSRGCSPLGTSTISRPSSPRRSMRDQPNGCGVEKQYRIAGNSGLPLGHVRFTASPPRKRKVRSREDFRTPQAYESLRTTNPRAASSWYGDLSFQGRLQVSVWCPTATAVRSGRVFFLLLKSWIDRFKAGCVVRWALFVIPSGACGAVRANGMVGRLLPT